jgi:hypothetical protein
MKKRKFTDRTAKKEYVYYLRDFNYKRHDNSPERIEEEGYAQMMPFVSSSPYRRPYEGEIHGLVSEYAKQRQIYDKKGRRVPYRDDSIEKKYIKSYSVQVPKITYDRVVLDAEKRGTKRWMEDQEKYPDGIGNYVWSEIDKSLRDLAHRTRLRSHRRGSGKKLDRTHRDFRAPSKKLVQKK